LVRLFCGIGSLNSYLVTPLAFNICISLRSDKFELCESFGNIEIPRNLNSSQTKISTEFPSFQNDLGEKKPGPLLFTLSSKSKSEQPINSEQIKKEDFLDLTYDDLSGVSHKISLPINFSDSTIQNEIISNPGIEKAVLLVQYSLLITSIFLLLLFFFVVKFSFSDYY
jgi:hypothetical protein